MFTETVSKKRGRNEESQELDDNPFSITNPQEKKYEPTSPKRTALIPEDKHSEAEDEEDENEEDENQDEEDENEEDEEDEEDEEEDEEDEEKNENDDPDEEVRQYKDEVEEDEETAVKMDDKTFPIHPGMNEEESHFFRVFRDFPYFMGFIYGNVCETDANKLSTGETLNDPFCGLEHHIIYTFFTTEAEKINPSYSLYRVPGSIKSMPNPFYEAIKYVYARMPRFNPSNSKCVTSLCEHEYVVIFNRLIYYYQLFLIYKEGKLRGFENSAGCIIMTHGGYEQYDETIIKDINEEGTPSNLENLFICHKSSPGCIGLGGREHLGKPTSELNVMVDNMLTKGYVNFDQVIFQLTFEDTCLMFENTAITKEELQQKYPEFNSEDINLIYEDVQKMVTTAHHQQKADCYDTQGYEVDNSLLEFKLQAKTLIHTILPNSKKYLNKTYQFSRYKKNGSYSYIDDSHYAIDLQLFLSTDKSLPIHDRLDRASILHDPYFNDIFDIRTMDKIIMGERNKKIKQRIEVIDYKLKNVVDYYKTKYPHVENLFIYDSSCGGIEGDPLVFTEGRLRLQSHPNTILNRVNHMARLGLNGGGNNKITRKSYRKKKSIKKSIMRSKRKLVHRLKLSKKCKPSNKNKTRKISKKYKPSKKSKKYKQNK